MDTSIAMRRTVLTLSVVLLLISLLQKNLFDIGMSALCYVPLYALILRFRWKRRRLQRNLNEHARHLVDDDPNFTLYLRPFVSANRLWVSNGLMSVSGRFLYGHVWDLEFGLNIVRPEHPLVAVGTLRGSFGAAKILDADAGWFDLVKDLAARARLILIVPLGRPATLQELAYVLNEPARAMKTIIIMPSRNARLLNLVLALLRVDPIVRLWNKARRELAAQGIVLPRYRLRGAILIPSADGTFRMLRARGFRPDYLRAVFNMVERASRVGAFVTTDQALSLPSASPSAVIGRYLTRVVTPAALLPIVFAVAIRSFAFEPFNIPSGSMEPTLLVGDYLFVSKYSYGYSRFSLPYSPPLFKSRIFGSLPKRGDVVVFKYPRDTSTDYIKRIIGLPNDRIQVKQGLLYINGQVCPREPIGNYETNDSGYVQREKLYMETLPNGVPHEILKATDGTSASRRPGFDPAKEFDPNNTIEYIVPPDHLFAMGDHRDNSADSRFMNAVGYVPVENLVGRAEILFFSTDSQHPWYEFWWWPVDIRWSRLLHPVR